MSPPKMSLGGDVEQVERCDVEWIQMERSELISTQGQGWRSQRDLRKEVWVIRGSLQVSSGVSLTDPENMNSEEKNRCRDFTTFVVLTVTDRQSSQSRHTRVQHGAERSSISQKHVQQEKLKIKNHINHKLFRLLTANTEICLCHYGNVSLFYKTAALSTRWTSVSPDWNVTCVRQTRNKHKQRNHVAQSHDHDNCSLCNAQPLHQQLDFQPSAHFLSAVISHLQAVKLEFAPIRNFWK